MTDTATLPAADRLALVDNFIADFKRNIADLEALPNEGSVLFFAATALALNFTDEGKPHVCGVAHARVFTDAERGLVAGVGIAEPLRHTYRNGKGEKAMLTSVQAAKNVAIEHQRGAMAALESQRTLIQAEIEG